jgi:hypothetical protein
LSLAMAFTSIGTYLTSHGKLRRFGSGKETEAIFSNGRVPTESHRYLHRCEFLYPEKLGLGG